MRGSTEVMGKGKSASVKKGAGGSERAARTFSEAVRSYVARRGGLSRTTSTYLERHERAWRHVNVRCLTSEVLNDWLDLRLRQVSAPTARRELNVALAVLAHAAARGWCDPVVMQRPEDGEPRLRWLTDEEVSKFMHGALDVGYDVWRLASCLLSTGARIGEAVVLTDKDVEEGWVTLRTRKRKGGKLSERRVPVTKVTRDFLVDGRTGRLWPYATPQAAAYGLSKAARLAGVEDFQPHDLRRTFATRLLMKGVNPRVVATLDASQVAMIMGWSEADVEAMKRKYVSRREIVSAVVERLEGRTQSVKRAVKRKGAKS